MSMEFDVVDAEILKQYQRAFDLVPGPRVGDFLRTSDGMLRFTHDWGEDIQTTVKAKHPCYGDSSFYLGEGYASFSGSLDPAISKTLMRDTGETAEGSFWFFHHGFQGAGRGVNFRIPCRVYTLEPRIIKGCPRDKWEEVQAIQDDPFIFIQSNGSHWMGEEEDDVDGLVKMLESHPLDPRFETFYCVDPCRGVEDPNRRGHYINGERLYRVDGVHDFFGNFLEYSHVFSISTNHKPTIELLTRLIDANMQREDYLAEAANLQKKEQAKQEQARNEQDPFWMVNAV
jgi:hypothetical protein